MYVLLFGIGEKFSCNKFFIKKGLYVRVSSKALGTYCLIINKYYDFEWEREREIIFIVFWNLGVCPSCMLRNY